MQQVAVGTKSKAYKVFIEAGLRHSIGEHLASILDQPASAIFVISDSQVAPLYLDEVVASFQGKLPVYTEVIPSGEASKSFTIYEQALSKALSCGLDRKAVVIALGGGVVGDLAGFVAATYMRGIRFVQVPTTLLAHDSSVGGKVAINHPLGKNMIGSFHQPEAVFYDIETLYSLSEREWRSGFAEVMKHGFIKDPEFLGWLAREVTSLEQIPVEKITSLLQRSIEVKALIVTEDERESGVRAYLNLGHTLGHAIETELGYGVITHGEAVVVGMVFALHLSEEVFQIDLDVNRYEAWFRSLGYKTSIPEELSASKLINTMMKDKKVEAGVIRMVLLRELGQPTVKEVSPEVIGRILERALNGGR
ncbi:3-dehydroquinate synthase [bacterium LRH843]|nr:3-dehydroquinate synthase [bacterium LRH843]